MSGLWVGGSRIQLLRDFRGIWSPGPHSGTFGQYGCPSKAEHLNSRIFLHFTHPSLWYVAKNVAYQNSWRFLTMLKASKSTTQGLSSHIEGILCVRKGTFIPLNSLWDQSLLFLQLGLVQHLAPNVRSQICVPETACLPFFDTGSPM